jgi:cysteinyl-tRNA synthetase
MEDDFNTADAIARIERLFGILNSRIDAKGKPDEIASLARTGRELAQTLGLASRPPALAVKTRRTLAAKRKGIDQSWVEEQICARLAARKAKDFASADAIRVELSAKGVELRDGAQGTDWRVLL